MEAQNKTYFTYLDALRFFAFLAVFYAHTGNFLLNNPATNAFPMNYWQKFTVYGVYGVNFFFVLSGFLITYLLLKEKEKKGTIAIKKFYTRRILRIWPVYFLVILVSIVILPHAISQSVQTLFPSMATNIGAPALGYFVNFLGNIYIGLGLGFVPFSIHVLWSVCVEEQFYLVWPWIVRWLSTKKLILATLLLIALSLVYKLIWGGDRNGNYYLTWSVGMDLAFGALFGIFYFAKRQRAIIVYTLATIGASCLVIGAALFAAYTRVSGLGRAVEISTLKSTLVEIVRLVKTPMIDSIFTLIILFFAGMTVHAYGESSNPLINLFNFLKKKVRDMLIYLGKISYGLYAYHTICLMLTVQILYASGFLTTHVTRTTFFITIFSALLLTILVAKISYAYFEKVFLSLKEKSE